jgi:hypothetical protein
LKVAESNSDATRPLKEPPGEHPTVAKRPRFSRWRRLPPVFRSGEHRPIGTGNELDRIILYLPSRLLDLAEALAAKAGVPAVQDYCERLLAQAIEAEQVRQKVTAFESRRGPLEGLKEVADDPDYLSEWRVRAEPKPAPLPEPPGDAITVDLVLSDGDDPTMQIPSEDEGITWEEDRSEEAPAGPPEEPERLPSSAPVPIATTPRPTVRVPADRNALEVLWRHVGHDGDDLAFLPCLRRGAAVPATKSAELLHALTQLEFAHRGAEVLDRRMAHALHRLALESQVLLTDAWPGVFDAKMIATIRAVQEAVERILSGQDIRY